MEKEQIKLEAIRRMKKLKLFDQIIKEFEEENILYKSENGGILYWLDDKEKAVVKEFENKIKEFNGLVYHVIARNTSEGKLLTMLFVSSDESPELFDDNISNNIIYTYIDAGSTEWTSEFGTEYISPRFGGLVIPRVESQEDYIELVKQKQFL
jgi:hypothetical protein